MSWDSVPWFVGGGATHSPEVARLLAFAATSGAEGIVQTTDLRVRPLAVPGSSIQVLPGAALILNRATSGDSQTYVARNPTADVVAVAPTGSSGKRSDLVVVQIEDPNMPGESWQNPTNPAVGPYVFTRVIPNVPAGTTRLQNVPGYSGRSAVTLARIDIPASTGTITAAMITDLREAAQPRSTRSLQTVTGIGGGLTSSTEVVWPANAFQTDIPSWATRLVGVAHYVGLVQSGGDYLVGGITAFDTDTANGAGQRVSIAVPIDVPIPASRRGTRQSIALLGRRGTGPGQLTVRGGTSVLIDFYFAEVPE